MKYILKLEPLDHWKKNTKNIKIIVADHTKKNTKRSSVTQN